MYILDSYSIVSVQICREMDRHPQLWEDVHHIDRALILNIGNLLEKWTSCVFRSTLHRVVSVGKVRYSVAFFINPNPDLVKCLESCCSEAIPPRFPPIRNGNYLEKRKGVTKVEKPRTKGIPASGGTGNRYWPVTGKPRKTV